MRLKWTRCFIWLLLLVLLFTNALAEDEEVYYIDIPQVPILTLISPCGDASYDKGGLLTVQAKGENVGCYVVSVQTADGNMIYNETLPGCEELTHVVKLPDKTTQELKVTVEAYYTPEPGGVYAEASGLVLSPKVEFIQRMMDLAYANSKDSRYKFAPAESDSDIAVCKNFVMRLFNTFASDYRMAEYPDVKLFMPKNNLKVKCAPYDYGIEWAYHDASEGCPFEITAKFRYNNDMTKAENAAQARLMMEQVQQGDFFQMVGNYGGGNGPHSLFFISDWDPETDMIHWTDSNMRGKRINGVRWGYLKWDADGTAEWFINCINTKKRGATLYRLRDDLYKP